MPYFVEGDMGVLAHGEYVEWLVDVKDRLRQSQAKAALRVNTTLLEFYWSLGRDIVVLKAETAWGNGVVKQLSLDLKAEFPDFRCISVRTIWNAKRWYLFYNEYFTKVKQPVSLLEMPEIFGQVPWGHHIQIFSKSGSVEEALFYVERTVEGGWSRRQLVGEMASGLYGRQGKAISNFAERLPGVQGELAQELLKDPYNFSFLTLEAGYREKELEEGLMNNITRFLLELGRGFAFVGRQMELRMPGGQTFSPDMVFYHIRLKAYVIVELKVEDFAPAFAGQLNFYVSAADHLLRGEDDNASIGLLICRSKDETVVQWSFEGMEKPLGVSTYELQVMVESSVRELEARGRG